MHSFIPAAALAAALAAPPPHPMEKIVVTAVASRVPEAVESTPAAVSVIERRDLERRMARDIRDALRYEPGVSVENGPARFGLGNINIRGLDGNRVQMLHDGIRLPDGYRVGSFSNASRNAFDLGLLSRIEILRGPGSALYGSDALAGVVATSTLDPREILAAGRAVGGFAEAGHAGSDDSRHRAGALAARSGPLEILLGASRSDGHERDNFGDVETPGAARTVPNPQDGDAAAQLAKLVLARPDGGRWRATFERFERRVATDVRSLNPQSPRSVSLLGDDFAERERTSVDARLFALGPVDRLQLLAYRQRSRTRQDTDELRANTTAACLSAPGTLSCRREARFSFAQDEVGLTAIAQSALGARHQLVYGAEWSRTDTSEMRDGRQTNLATGAVSNVVGTDAFPTRDFPNSRVERVGAFVQDEVALGFATLIPALRFDRFEMMARPDALYAAGNPGREVVSLTDAAWSPKLGLLVPLGAGMQLTAQAAAGFRAPPYFDVNVGLSSLPLGYTVIPNPDLEPENSRGLELGVRVRRGALDYGITAYRTDYRNLIVTRAPLPCPGDPRCVPAAPITFQSQNVTRARIEGIEARAAYALSSRWSLRAGASAARGDDRTTGRPLNSVDPAKVVLGVEYVIPAKAGIQFHLTHAFAKSRIDAASAAYFATPAYTTLDLTAHVSPTPNLTLHAGVFNVFDRKYWLWSDVRSVPNPGASIDRYTQPGRSFGVQARYRF